MKNLLVMMVAIIITLLVGYAPAQAPPWVIENRVVELERKVDDLTKKVDQLLNREKGVVRASTAPQATMQMICTNGVCAAVPIETVDTTTTTGATTYYSTAPAGGVFYASGRRGAYNGGHGPIFNGPIARFLRGN